VSNPLYTRGVNGKMSTAVQDGSLWGTVERLRREARLTMAQLARQSGLSRQTIYGIRDGRVPNAPTLRDLARGLSIHPQTGETDAAFRERAWRELFAAVDYPTSEPPTAQQRTTDDEAVRVRDLLIDAGYDSNGADVLDALARELLTLTQSERDAILPSMLAQIRAIRSVARR
jgi:transcriptional regulator with XRE-family HTH domain